MKGAEQLARSCRRLGREGVGARRAEGHGPPALPAARRKPRGVVPLPAPLRSAPPATTRCRAGSAGRGAPSPRARDGGG